MHGMKYCHEIHDYVYSCDHYECNHGSYKEQQGMKYCIVNKTEVYGCDHAECHEQYNK